MGEILEKRFYSRPADVVARELIGQVLVRETADGVTKGVIVECEAYLGRTDAAAHSYKGRTERTRVLFGEKGRAYVYLIYGMYRCLNVSSGPEGEPECVLIRALEPLTGLDLMARRRGRSRPEELCSGPGKLCTAMDIGAAQYGADMCSQTDGLWIERGGTALRVAVTPRINVDYAGEAAGWPLRFVAEGSPWLSAK